MCVDEIIKNRTLSYKQRVISLSKYAENTFDPIHKSLLCKKYFEEQIFCDLFEGNAPFIPRYILPDYDKFMKEGSKFLSLTPPRDIFEATNNLLIFYNHIPSITTFPVYLGNIDYLLEPFITDEEEAFKVIKLFLVQIDRTLHDSFVHANIGPKQTKAGMIILKAMEELELAVPNLTLKYDLEITPDEFSEYAAKVSLLTAKPSFTNHKINSKFFGEDYGIASCYNSLKVGGGGFTLMRLVLSRLALKSNDEKDFLSNLLPTAVKELALYINSRIDYIVNQAKFFNTSFLSKEGFIVQNNFSGLFGIVGLAEAVNELLKHEKNCRFGHSEKANNLAMQICKIIQTELEKYPSKDTKIFNGVNLLHAQVGIDTDIGISPGARIPVNEEPEIYDHIIMSAPFHQYFVSGIGDIFVFDQTYIDKPEAVLQIIKAAFTHNLRYISTYSEYCDVVRVTGYLVKRSEIAQLENQQVVLNNATILGKGAKDFGKALDRKRIR